MVYCGGPASGSVSKVRDDHTIVNLLSYDRFLFALGGNTVYEHMERNSLSTDATYTEAMADITLSE